MWINVEAIPGNENFTPIFLTLLTNFTAIFHKQPTMVHRLLCEKDTVETSDSLWNSIANIQLLFLKEIFSHLFN